MKKFLGILVLSFFICYASQTESSMPKCQGSDFKQWTNCQETFVFSNKDKYIGEWKDGKRHGQGIYIHWHGDKYVGEYIDGKRQGQGTLTFFEKGYKYVKSM